MLDDLTKTIKAQLHERATSPLSGSFVLSWTLWNYKVIVILIASMPVLEKLSYIDTHLFPTYNEILLRGALYPLLSALVYIFLYPFPSKYVYEYSRKRQKELKKVQQQIDDETPLTQEEARELRRESRHAEQEYEQQIAQHLAEIARLRDTIADLQQKGVNSDLNALALMNRANELEELNRHQVSILEKIATGGRVTSPSIFINQPDADQVLVQHNLDELERCGYITSIFENNHPYVQVTAKGRKYLVKHKANGQATEPVTVTREVQVG